MRLSPAADRVVREPAQGVLALALLIGLQFSITWSSVRARWIRQLVTGEAALLFFRG